MAQLNFRQDIDFFFGRILKLIRQNVPLSKNKSKNYGQQD